MSRVYRILNATQTAKKGPFTLTIEDGAGKPSLLGGLVISCLPLKEACLSSFEWLPEALKGAEDLFFFVACEVMWTEQAELWVNAKGDGRNYPVFCPTRVFVAEGVYTESEKNGYVMLTSMAEVHPIVHPTDNT
jgi:hypothetical protein